MATRTIFECDLCKRPIDKKDYFQVRRAETGEKERGGGQWTAFSLSVEVCSTKCLAGLAFAQPEKKPRR